MPYSRDDYWEIHLWPLEIMNWKMFFILISMNIVILAPAVWYYTHQARPSVVKETVVSCDTEEAASSWLSQAAKNTCDGRWSGTILFEKNTNKPQAVCSN